MPKTRYTGVYTDNNGKFFYQVELGIDKISGKRIQKKGRKDQNGKPFSSAREAYKELTRLKNEYLVLNGYSNYDLTYYQFMENNYLPFYKSNVERSTWSSRETGLLKIRDRFAGKKVREISIEDCELYRIWLLNDSGYSQAYSSLLYGMFRKTLDYAVNMRYLDENISKRTKAIPKGKSVVSYWTKEEFQKVLAVIYKDDFYEHMCFIMIWLYYMTGIRVSEGLALNWNDIDLKRKKMRIHHTLDMINQKEFFRKPYTKTENGTRVISLDGDTIKLLEDWKKVQQEHGIENYIISYTDLPLYRSTVQRVIERYAKIAKVPVVQGKGLRHSHVSYLINEFNADILVVSRRLGHSSPEITLKHYAHLWSRNDESLAEQMNGNISFTFAESSSIEFNGNQVVKKTPAKPLPS